MGYEYEGKLAAPIGQEAIRKLLDSLEADGRWRLVRRSDDGMALAYAGRPVNPSWPESIVIEASDSRIYILFHSGHGSQERDFLDTVTQILESLGAPCHLEDL